MHNSRLTHALTATAILALAACQADSGSGSSGDKAGGSPSPTAKSKPTKAASKPSYPGAKDGDKVASPGRPIELSGWTTTATAMRFKADAFGSRNLCTTVTMKNRDKEQQEYSPLSWKLQLPAGNVLDMTFTGDDKELDSSGLAPGGSVTGLVCFEDKKAGPGQYILSWQPDVFSSEDRGVWLNRL